jgi:hypothetical protein
VTGLCSLIWSRHPSFSNKRVRECLQNTATKLGPGSFSNQWGFGRIEAEAALRCGDFAWPFTAFTRFTPFTRFTLFTDFTRFTFFTAFTRFTPFTPFTRFTIGPGPVPGPLVEVRPFVRFGGTVFSQEELALDRFEQFAGVVEQLKGVGLARLDTIASSEPAALARQLQWANEDAARLVSLSQALLVALDTGRSS